MMKSHALTFALIAPALLAPTAYGFPAPPRATSTILSLFRSGSATQRNRSGSFGFASRRRSSVSMLLDPKQTMEEKQDYSTVLTAVTASAEDVLAAQSVAKRAPKEDSQYELSPQQVRVCRPS